MNVTLGQRGALLIGINGSGKSNFIKALRLLHEGMVGSGFEKLFAQKWGGFSGAGNFGKNGADKIALTYEFDAAIFSETLLSVPEVYQKSPLCFELIIEKNGRNGDSYTLSEWLYMENGIYNPNRRKNTSFAKREKP
jgi:predicted ATPase